MIGVRGVRVGPYDELYAATRRQYLWGENPGRLVERIAEFSPPSRTLDAGCGDGKNALFLERYGCDVVGIDVSTLASEQLHRRFKNARRVPTGQYILADLCDPLPEELGTFDVLVSYGLFHSLPLEKRLRVHQQIQNLVRPGGIMLFSALVEGIPVPRVHRTPGLCLASKAELVGLLEGWIAVEQEFGTIIESHPPLVGAHRHAAVWIVAERRR